jgi:tRNA nucleotidyltransferase (CCA-adding enzyme)
MDRRDMHAMLLADKPSEVIEHARLKGCLDKEIIALRGIPQDAIHHPEGDVYVHTLMVVDAAADIARREHLDNVPTAILILAALLHDVGKVNTTEIHDNGRITAYGHSDAGVDIAREFLSRNAIDHKYIDHILTMIKEHMVHVGFFTPDISTRVVRRIVNRIHPVPIDMLGYLIEADYRGRGNGDQGLPERMNEIIYLAHNLDIDLKPDPIITGDVIMRILHIDPSPTLGRIKDELYTLQMSGDIQDVADGILHLRLIYL